VVIVYVIKIIVFALKLKKNLGKSRYIFVSITQKHKFDYNVKRRPNVKTLGAAYTRSASKR